MKFLTLWQLQMCGKISCFQKRERILKLLLVVVVVVLVALLDFDDDDGVVVVVGGKELTLVAV